MQATSATNEIRPITHLETTDEIKAVVRVVLNEQRARSQSPSCGLAVISANRGAGTTSISNAIVACVNQLAMEREALRMAVNIAETVSSRPEYGARSGMMAAIHEVMTETAVCTDPSRLAITLDYRELTRPGVAFGDVVCSSLTPEVLRGQSSAGQSVKDVLDGLPIEWDSISHCRKDCLSLLADLFRLVVIDMPSREENAGFQEITSLADGVIIVVEQDRTTKHDVVRLTREIEASGGKIMGYVLNKHRNPIPNSLSRHLATMGLT